MKIVILDGETTNGGDISWKEIEDLGELKIYGDTPKELVVERSRDADIIISNRIVYTEETLKQLPNLKMIATLSTGFNTIDLEYTKKQGIVVSNVPFYCAEAVAQMAFALLLSLCNKTRDLDKVVKEDGWDAGVSESFKNFPLVELYGKNLGIIGYGTIGKIIANLGRALGMNILIYSRSEKPKSEGETLSIEELMKKSDVVSISCALNDNTLGMIDKKLLNLMKPTAFIINTARGAIINEADLVWALNNGIIGGAGLDVLAEEPPRKDSPILSAKNCIITPHIGWSPKEARQRLISIVAGNIEAFYDGKPTNQVNL